MVVLAAVTKDMMPMKGVEIYGMANSKTKKFLDRYLDHEYYALGLEMGLANHFMFSELDYSARCVPGNRVSAAMGDAISVNEKRGPKKFPGYVVYVAYR